jgi:hypothetical protein
MAGLVRRRPARLVGAMIGVGLALALLACVGSFIDSSVKTMTGRAISGLSIDWQILLNSAPDERAVRTAVHETDPEAEMETIEYADVPGLVAKTGETVQTTGGAAVLGIDATYKRIFPTEIAPMVGAGEGVLAAQQTAANLHVSIGDMVTIQRPGGLPPAEVKIDGNHQFARRRVYFKNLAPLLQQAHKRRPITYLCFQSIFGTACFRNQPMASRIPCVQKCTFARPDAICPQLPRLRIRGNCDRLTTWQ